MCTCMYMCIVVSHIDTFQFTRTFTHTRTTHAQTHTPGRQNGLLLLEVQLFSVLGIALSTWLQVTREGRGGGGGGIL